MHLLIMSSISKALSYYWQKHKSWNYEEITQIMLNEISLG